jgi:predicted GIY-YIG superfamily endonuclease
MNTVNFQGLSGVAYTFTPYPIGQAFLAVGAVYIVAYRYINDGKYYFKPIYIGETGDLSTRFDDHHKADCFTRNKANYICTHRDNNEDSRLKKEADLIDYWNPPCNG